MEWKFVSVLATQRTGEEVRGRKRLFTVSFQDMLLVVTVASSAD